MDIAGSASVVPVVPGAAPIERRRRVRNVTNSLWPRRPCGRTIMITISRSEKSDHPVLRELAQPLGQGDEEDRAEDRAA